MVMQGVRKRDNLIYRLLGAGAVAAVFLIFLISNRLCFSSNDDLLLRSIMSGDYTGQPDAHLIYIMYPLGAALKLLYTAIPVVPWYEIFTVIMHLACAAVLINSLSGKKRGDLSASGIAETVFYSVLVMGADLVFIFNSQYTELAGMAAAAAIAALLAGRDRTSAVFLSVSFMVRKQVFFMSLPVFAAAFVYTLFTESRGSRGEQGDERPALKVKELTKKAFPFAVTAVVILLSVAAETFAYRDDAWKSYHAFNSERVRVYDYALMPQWNGNEDFYGGLGISRDEYTALVEYDLSAVSGLSTADLKEIADRQQEILDDWKQYYNVFNKTLKDTAVSFLQNLRSLHGKAALGGMILLFALALTGLIRRRRKPEFFISVFAGVYYLAFIMLFSYLGRLPERVLYGIDFMTAALCLTVAGSLMKNSGAAGMRIRLILTGCVSVAFFVFGAGDLRRTSLKNSESINGYEEILGMIARDPDGIYYVDTNVFEHVPGYMGKTGSVYTEGNDLYEPVNMIKMADWAYESPLREEKYARLAAGGMFDTSGKESYVVLSERIGDEWLLGIFEERGIRTVESGELAGCKIYRIEGN